MADELRFENPDGVYPPLGPYSHTAVVPSHAELICISGQIGVRPDGTVGATIGQQADQAFANVVGLLGAHGLDVSRIVKLTVFIVSGHDGDEVKAARIKHMGAHEPTSTTVYVSQLVRPEWLVEVEAIAARL